MRIRIIYATFFIIPIRKNITPMIIAMRPRNPIKPNMITANPRMIRKFLFSMVYFSLPKNKNLSDYGLFLFLLMAFLTFKKPFIYSV